MAGTMRGRGHPETGRAAPPPFAFGIAGGDMLRAAGAVTPVVRGSAATVGARVAAALLGAGPEAVVAGAMPFDPEADDYLWRAGQSLRGPLPAAAAGPARPVRWRLRSEPDAAGYAASVRRALGHLAAEAGRDGGLAKVVLSRSLRATADRPIDVPGLLHRLAADPAACVFATPLPAADGAPRMLVGATPELLVAKRGARIASHPLAGSARRRADLAGDAAAAAALGGSEKDRREHAIVVEHILDALAPYCRQLWRPEGMAIVSTLSMWHIGTRIRGELKDADLPVPVLAAALHPTPAVAGLPRERSIDFIRALEPYDREFYAGAVGWCDAAGDGAWHVAIRCAEIAGAEARLFAGAGIVPGSDPWAEAAETGAKFGAMMTALGIPATVDASEETAA